MLQRKTKSLVILILIVFGLNVGIQQIDADDEIPITPNDEFFTILTEEEVFDIDPDTYRLIVTGEVKNPLNLSLDDIKSMPVTSEIVRIVCIGYTFGATNLTGVANWTGVSLYHILNMSKINFDTAVDISFHTPDLNPWAFSTSLKPEEAFWGDVILAYEMNGVPLPKEHGFPLRLVVPRFYGYKWIKWLKYINVTTEDYLGFYPSNGDYDDSPYVDVDLQIYYSPVSSDHKIPGSRTFWPGLEIFLFAIAIVLLPRFVKKFHKD